MRADDEGPGSKAGCALIRLESPTASLTRTVRFTYSPAGRVLTRRLPDQRVIYTTHDANGNVASITPPGRPGDAFA